MGDPHYNTWGGKNNSWGNRNRKKKDNDQNNTHYEPNKLFNTIAAGTMLFLAGALGLTIVGNVFSGLKNVKEAVDTVGDIKDTIQDVTSSNTTITGPGGSGKSLLDVVIENQLKFDLDEEDVAELIEKAVDALRNENVTASVDNLVTLDYNDANTSDKYTKNVVNKLSKYNKNITFAIVDMEILQTDEINSKVAELQEIASNTFNGVSGTNFKRMVTGGKIGMPNSGNFIFTVTYSIE